MISFLSSPSLMLLLLLHFLLCPRLAQNSLQNSRLVSNFPQSSRCSLLLSASAGITSKDSYTQLLRASSKGQATLTQARMYWLELELPEKSYLGTTLLKPWAGIVTLAVTS